MGSIPKTVTIPGSGEGDRIFLHGLEVECIIGFIEWERRVKQTIVIDVEMPVDCARAAASDDVADTLDYKKVAKRLIAFVSESDFKLVETLAHRAAMLILAEFSVPVIFITAFPERLLTGERPEPTFLITKPFQRSTVKAAIAQALFFDTATVPA